MNPAMAHGDAQNARYCRPGAHQWRTAAEDEQQAWLSRLPAFLASADLAVCTQCQALRAMRDSLIDLLYPSHHDLQALDRFSFAVGVGDMEGAHSA